ncbi:MAG: protein-L-isoaspartate(D-aspartate) O-methyltransferase [Gemmatimonadota bacterium]
MTTADYRRDRRRLVELLRSGGISDLAVLHAFDAVPRHAFVPEGVRHRAYENAALPLGNGQTISRPDVHARHLCLAQLTGNERVLEVGTGSGFQTALLARLARHVYSIEVVPELAARAQTVLDGLDLSNVTLRTGDGSVGWPDEAPFDVILVGAAGPSISDILKLQLAPEGRLIVPVGQGGQQTLYRVRRGPAGFEAEQVDSAYFVPLIGDEGW